MKRKLLTALIMISALSFTACQEDSAMEELVDDIELTQTSNTTGNGGSDNSDGPGSN